MLSLDTYFYKKASFYVLLLSEGCFRGFEKAILWLVHLAKCWVEKANNEFRGFEASLFVELSLRANTKYPQLENVVLDFDYVVHFYI